MIGNPAAGDDADVPTLIERLSDDSFRRRNRATDELLRRGPGVLPQLAHAVRGGDAETSERAIRLMQRMAVEQPFLPAEGTDQKPEAEGADPPDEPAATVDAWDQLALVADGGGAAGGRAETAMAEVRGVRRDRAAEVLRRAGFSIGEREFIVAGGARSIIRRQVRLEQSIENAAEVAPLLQWIDDIHYVHLEGEAISAGVLRGVAMMPNLRSVTIEEGVVTAAQIAELAPRDDLRNLDVSYVPLDEETIAAIADLPLRLSLTLNGTDAPPEAIEQLRLDRPELRIVVKQGGFLGIRCYPMFGNCQISEVVPGSGAESAGLLADDNIVEADGKPVRQFADLQAAIMLHTAGETIEIAYVRDGEVRRTKAELGKMELH